MDSRWLNTDRIGGTHSYQIAAVEGVWNNGPTQVVGGQLFDGGDEEVFGVRMRIDF